MGRHLLITLIALTSICGIACGRIETTAEGTAAGEVEGFTSLCNGAAGTYLCVENCDRMTMPILIAEEPSFSIQFGGEMEPLNLTGSCPDFTFSMAPEGRSEIAGQVTFTSNSEFRLTAPEIGTVGFRKGEIPDYSQYFVDTTCLPAADNTFNPNIPAANMVFSGTGPEFQLTWSPPYTNCRATLENETMTLTCDNLGTLRPRIEVNDSEVTLTQEIQANGPLGQSTQRLSYRCP